MAPGQEKKKKLSKELVFGVILNLFLYVKLVYGGCEISSILCFLYLYLMLT